MTLWSQGHGGELEACLEGIEKRMWEEEETTTQAVLWRYFTAN